MAAVVGALRVELAANIARLQRDLGKAAQTVRSAVASKIQSFARLGARGRIAIGAITTALAGATASILALGKKGTTLAGIADSFDALTRAVGQSGEEMLRLTRDATRGLITDMEIMQAANKGLLLGLPITSSEMANLARTASVLGAAMGQEANKSLDDLITALGRSSPLILDNLGLTVKSAEANERYAATLGVSVKELTDAQKKQAFYNAAMGAAQEKLLELSEAPLTFGQRLDVIQVGFQNFVDTLAVAISKSPALNTALQAIGTALQSAFGTNQQEMVATIMGFVDKLAIGLVDMAQLGAQAARLLSGTWSALRVAFSAVMFAIVGGLELIAKGITAIATAGSKLPVVGQRFREAAAMAQGMATQLEGMRQSFANQTREAVQKAGEQDAALKGLAGTLGAVKAEMITASQSTDIAATATEGFVDQVAGANAALTHTGDTAAPSATAAIRETTATVLEGVSAFSMLRGAVGGWSEVNALSIPVLESIGEIQQELSSKTIPGLIESFGELHKGVESVTVEIDDSIKTTTALKRVFKSAVDWIGDVKDAFFDLGNVTASVIHAAFGPSGLVTQLFQKGLNMMANAAWAGLKKIGGFFKSLFGGPSADELAGREIVHRFEENLSSMLTDSQRLEAGNESWKKTVIAIRDAYVEQGRSEQEALRDAERLWKSSKEGAEASRRVIEEITRKMNAFGRSAERAARAVADAMGVNFGAGGQAGSVVPMQHGGIVRRPTIALVGEAGPEAVVPLHRLESSGGLGAEALARIERLMVQQPAMLVRALRDAQLLSGAMV